MANTLTKALKLLVSTGTDAVTSDNYATLMPSVGAFYHRTGQTDPEVFTRHSTYIIEKLDPAGGGWGFAYNFTPATITVTAPVSSTDWYAGSTNNITWDSTDLDTNVKISYYDGSSWYVLTSNHAYNEAYPWTISATQAAVSATWKVKVEKIDDATINDESDTFDVINPDLNITVPSAGSLSYAIGATPLIKWTYGGGSGKVTIDLYKTDEATKVYEIVSGFDSSTVVGTVNEYQWFVDGAEIGTPSGTYKIKITDTNGSVNTTDQPDFSDNAFTITNAEIGVTTPTAHTTVYAGNNKWIRWGQDAGGNTENVNIKLYKAGSLHATLTSNIADIGEWYWSNIHSDYGTGTDDYQIYVQKVTTTSIDGYSDPYFKINAALPTIYVSDPDTSNEVFTMGESTTIAWSITSGSVSTVKIKLRKLNLSNYTSSAAYDITGDIDAASSPDTWTVGNNSSGVAQAPIDNYKYAVRVEDVNTAAAGQGEYFYIEEAPVPEDTNPVCNSIHWANSGGTNVSGNVFLVGQATTFKAVCTYANTAGSLTPSSGTSGNAPTANIVGGDAQAAIDDPISHTFQSGDNFLETNDFSITADQMGSAVLSWSNDSGSPFSHDAGGGAGSEEVENESTSQDIFFGKNQGWGCTNDGNIPVEADLNGVGDANSYSNLLLHGQDFTDFNDGFDLSQDGSGRQIGCIAGARIYFAVPADVELTKFRTTTNNTNWTGDWEPFSEPGGDTTFNWGGISYNVYYTGTHSSGSNLYWQIKRAS